MVADHNISNATEWILTNKGANTNDGMHVCMVFPTRRGRARGVHIPSFALVLLRSATMINCWHLNFVTTCP